MENNICKTCQYFRLHYTKHARGRYAALLYGHCGNPRLKKRYADDQACSFWEEP